MNMVSYEPWQAVRRLSDEMSRLFSDTLRDGEDGSNIVTSSWVPAVDIKEEPERFVIIADVPGVDPKEIEVTMEAGVLSIRGERSLETREEGGDGYRRVERRHGTFYRRFSLPDTADADKIAAKGSNGVLQVIIPKKEAVQPKRIKVSS